MFGIQEKIICGIFCLVCKETHVHNRLDFLKLSQFEHTLRKTIHDAIMSRKNKSFKLTQVHICMHFTTASYSAIV